MGNSSTATAVKPAQRASTVSALRQQTVAQLQSHTPALLTMSPWSQEGTASLPAMLHAQALTYAQRGGTPLLKGELVHLIMTLRHLTGVPITIASYSALMLRGVDELYAVLRAILYSVDFLRPSLDMASTASAPPLSAPPVSSSPASAPPASAPPASAPPASAPPVSTRPAIDFGKEQGRETALIDLTHEPQYGYFGYHGAM